MESKLKAVEGGGDDGDHGQQSSNSWLRLSFRVLT